MSVVGSEGSGEDLQAGRDNRAESTTMVFGGRPSELNNPFNGVAVLEAAPRGDSQRPFQTLNGVLGRGGNGTAAQAEPGAGVVGLGASNHGAGVVGLGAGSEFGPGFLGGGGALNEGGAGGVGVIGIGGAGYEQLPTPAKSGYCAVPKVAAPGLVGKGGTSHFNHVPVPLGDRDNVGHGPGVVGIAGGASLPDPTNLTDQDLQLTQSVGVFGFGGSGARLEPDGNGGTVFKGPTFPGAGVFGVGGRADATAFATEWHGGEFVGPGVVGLHGDVKIPPLVGAGVAGFAASGAGVQGRSIDGNGLDGRSEGWHGLVAQSDRVQAATFGSPRRAQILLYPIINTDLADVAKFEGTAGDLLALGGGPRDTVSLWFCTRSGEPGTAIWAKLA